jgi:hypothetical protein
MPPRRRDEPKTHAESSFIERHLKLIMCWLACSTPIGLALVGLGVWRLRMAPLVTCTIDRALRERKRCACNEAPRRVAFNESYRAWRASLLGALRRAPMAGGTSLGGGLACADASGLWLQFGVWRGATIRKIAAYRALLYSARPVEPPPVIGFDSFRGLPEHWRKGISRAFGAKGAFSLSGQPPFPANASMEWEVGLFNATLPPFVHRHVREPLSFVHVDCDLYASTRSALFIA